MEDFYYAGGLPAVLRQMSDVLDMDVPTVTGRSHKENITDTGNIYNEAVIYPFNKPLIEEAGIVVLKGNLALNGAVIKPSAATPGLMQHRGRAVVFENIEDYHARIDDPDLDIDETCVMVLKCVGPVGYPGMPEVGNMTLPKKILAKGVTDMVRISDGRMSGTAFGTVVLHVSPESAIGGNLGLVQNGDMIKLDVANRLIALEVSDEALAERRKSWIAPPIASARGYVNLYVNHVQQADKGADLDFLVGGSGSDVPRDSH
jgi:dihydroxy-acid dehydratase